MSLITDIRKSVTTSTPVLVAVGATDLAVEKARELPQVAIRFGSGLEDRRTKARARVEGRIASMREFDLKTLPEVAQAKVQQVPTLALTATLEAAGKAEEAYEDLAVRGKELLGRIASQQSTQDLVQQGKVTLARGKAAVTTVRHGAKDTKTAGKAAVTTARREAGEASDEVQKTVTKETTGTKAATKRTATTARKRATTAKQTTKSATTSARKTAAAAVQATGDAATKVGD